jgi:hypothetical protein
MAVVQEAVEHGSDGRAVAEQFSPVLVRLNATMIFDGVADDPPRNVAS